MHQTISFKKKLIASAVASCALSGFSTATVAQEPALEEVVVTGIRGSVMRAMDIKRDASGVVDAISAEDIGKFPDTNLAESLQRITGVSISRENGEGSEVTVRGMGGNYNMVTLNGRHMPSSNNADEGVSNSRAFDFANLAAEGVQGVQVYKTGRAEIASGGIGATVNINTLRPLDNPGLTASVGVKAVHDTTNRTGDDVTPDISGIFSWTTDNERFGVAIAGNYQERDSGTAGSYVTNWVTSEWDRDSLSLSDDIDISGEPDEGQLWSRPSDLRYTINDVQRERTNGQVTLQFRPEDRITGTLDYFYAENEVSEHRSEQSIWYLHGDALSRLEFDASSGVKTPLIYAETLDPANYGADALTDLSFAQREHHTVTELESLGLNLSFDITDDLNVTLDYRDSSSDSLPNNPYGSQRNASVAGFVLREQGVDWSSDLPVMMATFDDSGLGTPNPGTFGVEDLTTTRGTATWNEQRSDIEQLKLDGSWTFDEGSIDFGIETRTMENSSRQAQVDPVMGDWGGADPTIVPDDFFVGRDFPSEFDDYGSAGDDRILRTGFDWDFEQVTDWAANQVADNNQFYDFVGGQFQADRDWHTNRMIEEETMGLYFQVNVSGELGGMATNFVAGARYEETDITSVSNVKLPDYVEWQDNDDFQVELQEEETDFERTGSYDYVLPSMDFDIEVIDNVKARFSYSKTLARPQYNFLRAEVGGFNISPDVRTAEAGDPSVLPLTSDNLDLSVEWYYDDASYVSAGYYRKRVDDFIGNVIEEETHFGLRDPMNGPRVAEARQDLIDEGNPSPGLTQVFDRVLVNEGKDPADETTSVFPESDDPLITWDTTVPQNNETANIDGWELAAQHVFADTGFGLQANYTIVDGDIGYDVNAIGNQFAIFGLSDTANLVAFYDKDRLQARLAYNWRDEYLTSATYGGGNEPAFVEKYAQLDANVSYDITDELTVFFEGINLTEENSRQHARSSAQLVTMQQLGARYQIGARYTF